MKPAINPRITAITVTMATFMELLDSAIANVALPHIAGGLAVSYDESTWVLTSYLVANAIVLPLSAWLSRVFGRKNYYMTCVALFTISSLLCGLAPSLGLLVFFGFCRALTEADSRQWNRQFLSIPSLRPNVPPRLLFTAWRLLLRPLSDRRWEAGSRTASRGAGFSLSIFR